MKDTYCIESKCEQFVPKERAGIGGAPMGSGRCKLVEKGLKKLKECPKKEVCSDKS